MFATVALEMARAQAMSRRPPLTQGHLCAGHRDVGTGAHRNDNVGAGTRWRVMLLYLRHAWDRKLVRDPHSGSAELDDALREGAVQRVRPTVMTVAAKKRGRINFRVFAK